MRRKSIYSLSKQYGVSESALQRYRKKEQWVQADYVSQIDKWKAVEEETKRTVGDTIVIIADKLKNAAINISPDDVNGLINLSRAVKTIGEIVGLKSSLDIKLQEERLNALHKRYEKEKPEPIEIILNVPEEYCV